MITRKVLISKALSDAHRCRIHELAWNHCAETILDWRLVSGQEVSTPARNAVQIRSFKPKEGRTVTIRIMESRLKCGAFNQAKCVCPSAQQLICNAVVDDDVLEAYWRTLRDYGVDDARIWRVQQQT